VGSLLCAVSWSIHALIGFRVIQAVGAGVLAPLALATTALVFPPSQRGLGLALIAVVANVAAALASWHWIFAVNVPIGIVGVLLALRVMPETYDLTATQRVDWIGMATLGGSIFCLTFALVEANSWGWGSGRIVGLFVASVVLLAAFAVSQRWGRWPMLVPSLVRNPQFMGACAAFLLFAVGVMGPLFLAVLAFVNMWGYSQLDAALAVSPIPLVGMAVAPLVGRRADKLPPRVVGFPALAVMALGVLWLSDLPARPHYVEVLPALVLMGVGMGATFPAINVGAMGSISGQELGLGSGIVNMSRQVGFALGVALLVAVFTGVAKDHFTTARAEAAATAQRAGYSPRQQARLVRRAFDPERAERGERFKPRNRVERVVGGTALDAVRDAFAAGFRVAALAVLLAVPFSLTMRRRPADAHAAAAAAAAA
jgi:MFS family permease